MDLRPKNELLDATVIKHTFDAVGTERTRLNFADAVTRAFAFLADHGFVQVEGSPTIVRYRKGDVEADVYHGRSSFELGFEVSHGGTKYSIGDLIRHADPDAARQYRHFAATTHSAMTEGLAQLASLVERYGRETLQGDHTVFATLESKRKSWAEGYALDVLEGQLRPKADDAFRRGDYREAAELYERIQPRLTPAEKKKLSIARQRGG